MNKVLIMQNGTTQAVISLYNVIIEQFDVVGPGLGYFRPLGSYLWDDYIFFLIIYSLLSFVFCKILICKVSSN